MAADTTAFKVDIAALRAAAVMVQSQHDSSAEDLNTLLAQLESQLQQLGQLVPNVIDHARGENSTVDQQGTTLLGLWEDLADSLGTTADEFDPLARHAAQVLREIN